LRSSPAVRRRRLALELRLLRDGTTLTIEQVAAKLECSVSKISRIETGLVKVSPGDLRDMLALYQVTGARREELIQLARDARQKGWWDEFGESASRLEKLIGLEAEATEIAEFQTQVVPGLMQTADYTRAIFDALAPELEPDDVEQKVKLRMARQEHLELPPVPQLDLILDEAVLHRPVGGAEVMRAQLKHLIERAASPNVTVQVLPYRESVHGWGGSFSILRFKEPLNLDLVYLEREAEDAYLDSEDSLRSYDHRFTVLRAKALSTAESMRLITELAEG
jgi:transcriptional regulator with XRE-family HTH domain